jgi:DNA-binding PadR family transcriptional regulator
MGTTSVGEFEQLVLLAILRLGGEAYGVPIFEEVERRTGRTVTQAAGYLALRRLEDKGWLVSRMGDPTPQRGGRAKRFYRLAPEGLAQIKRVRAQLVRMWDGLEPELDVP